MKTAVIVVLALAAGALGAPQGYNQYQSTPYQAPYSPDYYNTYSKPDYTPKYNDYQPQYNDYSKPDYTPKYNDYSKPDYTPKYNDYTPKYNDYSKPDYNSYQPDYNNYQPDYKSYQPSYNSYQPDYKSYQPDYKSYQPTYNSYQPNYYGKDSYYQKKCAPLSSIKPLKKGRDLIVYVAGEDVTEAYCGSSNPYDVNVFYVQQGYGGKCVTQNNRGKGLEESLTFNCNHKTGQWDLLAGSDTDSHVVRYHDIYCGTATAATAPDVSDWVVVGCADPNLCTPKDSAPVTCDLAVLLSTS